MKILESLAVGFGKLSSLVSNLGKRRTVGIVVRGKHLRATITGEKRGKLHRVSYDDPNGYPVQKWIELSPEQIAELQ